MNLLLLICFIARKHTVFSRDIYETFIVPQMIGCVMCVCLSLEMKVKFYLRLRERKF